jgi:trehalose 2-sulfotransferase
MNAAMSTHDQSLASRQQLVGDLRGYAICTEQRTGSSYLCQVLASTGVLGRPLEYFNGPGMATFQPDYPQNTEDQLREITRQGATDNGVYGVKLFSADFDRIARSGWTQRLPNLRFISLIRRDLLGQAISATRLAQTDQYSADVKPVREASYDAKHIAREIHRLAWGQARWAAFFARCGLAPLYLDYDEIAADPQHTAERVAHLLGLGDTIKVNLGEVYTRVQRDSTSDAWRARFIADAHGGSFLDRPLPPSFLSRLVAQMKTQVRRGLQGWRA